MSQQRWSKRIFWIILGALLVTDAGGSRADSWVRRAGGCYASESSWEPFMMDTIGSTNGHLVGTASYYEYRATHLPVTIEGRLDSDNQFWPNVTAQVANDMKGEWKAIETNPRPGGAAIFTVAPKSANIMLHMDLDAFRPFIGKMQFGRLLLKNGEAAAFRLTDLMSPQQDETNVERQNPKKWTRDMIFGGPHDPLTDDSPFALLSISGRGDDVEGVCAYFDSKATSAISIEGTEAADGQFWPHVVAQVAQDYRGVWIVLGQSSDKGKSAELTVRPKDLDARLHVDLDVFRPMVGKFKYGRVVLRNGVSAAFELKDILP